MRSFLTVDLMSEYKYITPLPGTRLWPYQNLKTSSSENGTTATRSDKRELGRNAPRAEELYKVQKKQIKDVVDVLQKENNFHIT